MDATLAPQNLDALPAMIWTWSVDFLPRIVTAVVILFIGVVAARWLSRFVLRLAERTTNIDPTVEPMLASVVRYAILILVFLAALSQIGIQTASLLTVLGAAGLAVGLALQGTLSNIAAGLMLLWLRPFRVGDYVEVVAGNAISGTVKEVGLFACQIESFDGILIFAPNSSIWNFPLRNHSGNKERLVGVTVVMTQEADIGRARAVLLDMMANDPNILTIPVADVFVDRLTNGEISLTCRFWAVPSRVGDVQRWVVEEARRRLAGAENEALTPHQVVRIIPGDSDPSRLLAHKVAA